MSLRRNGGIRGRLDRLEGNAHATMNQAQSAISALREALLGLIEELEDGVTLHLTRTGSATLMDFLEGRVDQLPISIRLEMREPSE